MSDAPTLEQQLLALQEENANLRKHVADPDLRAFEQIRDLRNTNKKLTDEVKRLTTECMQFAFKSRQLEHELKNTQVQLETARSQQSNLGHSLEELQGELSQSRELANQSRELALEQEAQFERQRQILAEHQRQVAQLNEEVEQREQKISVLETLVSDLKDQYLSGEIPGFAVEEALSSAGRPFEILATHLEKTLGFSGRTMVEQVFELSGVSSQTEDPALLEDVFEALQDTGIQLLRGTPAEADLQVTLEQAWDAVQVYLGQGPPLRGAAGGGTEDPAAPKQPIPVVPVPAPVAAPPSVAVEPATVAAVEPVAAPEPSPPVGARLPLRAAGLSPRRPSPYRPEPMRLLGPKLKVSPQRPKRLSKWSGLSR